MTTPLVAGASTPASSRARGPSVATTTCRAVQVRSAATTEVPVDPLDAVAEADPVPERGGELLGQRLHAGGRQRRHARGRTSRRAAGRSGRPCCRRPRAAPRRGTGRPPAAAARRRRRGRGAAARSTSARPASTSDSDVRRRGRSSGAAHRSTAATSRGRPSAVPTVPRQQAREPAAGAPGPTCPDSVTAATPAPKPCRPSASTSTQRRTAG